jgi:hypothetical protein
MPDVYAEESAIVSLDHFVAEGEVLFYTDLRRARTGSPELDIVEECQPGGI